MRKHTSIANSEFSEDVIEQLDYAAKERGYKSTVWGGIKQWYEAGRKVRPGEKSVQAFYTSGLNVKKLVLFNSDQTDLRVSDADAIRSELARIFKSDEAPECISVRVDGSESILTADGGDPIAAPASSMLAVLRALPGGCPIDEGLDGSLWEALTELELEGQRKAIDYVELHHGKRVGQ